MQVDVRLFANLRDRFPATDRGRGRMELDPGATLTDLIDRLEIPRAQAQMVLVNGEQAPRGAARAKLELADGDVVAIFPPLAGG